MRGSRPRFRRRKRGRDVVIKEGMIAWSNTTGAMLIGTVHELKDVRAENTDRGGCVEGVRIILVRAMSSGERMILAMPAAETATASDIPGDSEGNISYPPKAGDGEENAENCDVRPGSGRDNTAARNDLENEVRVDNRIE